MNLDNIPDKTENRNTTSLKFKEDLIQFFKDKNLNTCLELGTNHGWSTKILSNLFKTVHTVDYSKDNIAIAKTNNEGSNNITFHTEDVYNTTIWNTMPKMDVVFIDCMHTYEHVLYDINTAMSLFDVDKGMYIVFDDYGHPQSTGVKDAILQAIREGLKVESYIGQDKGYQYNASSILIDREGIILSYGK